MYNPYNNQYNNDFDYQQNTNDNGYSYQGNQSEYYGQNNYNPYGNYQQGYDSYDNNGQYYNPYGYNQQDYNPYGYAPPYYQTGPHYSFVSKREIIRDPFVTREATHLKKLGLLAGAGVLGFIFMREVMVILIRVLGLTDLYLNSFIFQMALSSIISVISVFVPFRVVYACYSKGDKEKCYDYGKPVSAKAFFLAIMSGFMMCCVGDFVTSGFSGFVSCFGVQFKDFDSSSPAGVADFLMMTLECAIVPALVEEYAIRNVVMQPLRRFGDRFAIVVSSVIFALMHGNMIQIPFAFVAGLALGYFAIATKSIWTSVIIHFLNNFLAVVTSTVSANTNYGGVFYLISILCIIAAGTVCLIFFIKTDHAGLGLTYADKENKILVCVFSGFFVLVSIFYSLFTLKATSIYITALGTMIVFAVMYIKSNNLRINTVPLCGLSKPVMLSIYAGVPTVILSLFFLILDTVNMVELSNAGGILFSFVLFGASTGLSVAAVAGVYKSGVLEKKTPYIVSIVFLSVTGFLSVIYIMLLSASAVIK